MKVKPEDVGKQVCEQEEDDDDDEDVYDDFDFTSQKWAMKVKLEDIGKLVCERKFRIQLGHPFNDPLVDLIH
ncbi:unnamed protein product [Dibothriocephalus latus]|uniref:Uncharacterized protein n=1 Tax=Dibothriocephalus latus TaxID=60516 RepID=A0A3P6V8E0_DIBLA|nr:unnamed protein product [Dibothriocephalus latus]